MANSSERAKPTRVPALLSAIGGGLAVGAYFLPWSIGNKVIGVSGPSNLVVFSAWDNITRLAFGQPFVNSQIDQHGTTPGSVFYALLVAAPLIMATVIVLLGVWGVVRRPGPVRCGFFAAAATLTVLSSLTGPLNGSNASYYALGGYYGPSGFVVTDIANASFLGLGPLVLYLGLFIIIGAGVAAAVQRTS